MKKETYVPKIAKVVGIKKENPEIRTLKLELEKNEKIEFMPGQFVQVSVFGTGEAPISICSSPFQSKYFEISIRDMGNVTNSLLRLKKGDTIGIRGPYGKGYPMERFEGKDLVVVAGGIGFPPLASVVEYIINKRKDFGKVMLLYGARDPNDLMFRESINRWKKKGIDVFVTVDKGDKKWKGNVGVVTTLFDKYDIKGNVGVSCGPPIMLKFVTKSFQKIGIKDSNIYLSLERLMQCGVGKCGHCNIGNKYVCLDGPVFTFEDLKGLTEKVW
jgi:sulfite reductase subunit B